MIALLILGGGHIDCELLKLAHRMNQKGLHVVCDNPKEPMNERSLMWGLGKTIIPLVVFEEFNYTLTPGEIESLTNIYKDDLLEMIDLAVERTSTLTPFVSKMKGLTMTIQPRLPDT